MTTRILRVPVLLLCLVLAACGVPLQEDPETFTLPTATATSPGPSGGASTVTVFLVDDAGLRPVERTTPETSLPTVLTLLMQGPSTPEALLGLRSALVPGSLDPALLERGVAVRNGLAEVAVTRRFADTAAEDQLLATAQLVWTVTEETSARRVRVLLGEQPIELPTDEGLTSLPVSRTDYSSVAPAR